MKSISLAYYCAAAFLGSCAQDHELCVKNQKDITSLHSRLSALEAKVDSVSKAIGNAQFEIADSIKSANKESRLGVVEKLIDDYQVALSMLEWDLAAKKARSLCLVAAGLKQADETELYRAICLVPWQQIADISASANMDRDSKIREAAKLARDWSPLWQDIGAAITEELKKRTLTQQDHDEFERQLQIMKAAGKIAEGK